MVWRIASLAGLLAVTTAVHAVAQETVSGRDAQRMLYRPGPSEVVVYPQPFLTEAEQSILHQIAQQNVPYYGAIAVSPGDGLASEATTARGNYHDVRAAGAAVLADCNAKRSGSQPCVVVLEVRPRNWAERPLQLSAGATAVFRREYRRAGGEKAFAISPSSGGFGVGRGPGAQASAIASCGSAAGADDCRVVISD